MIKYIHGSHDSLDLDIHYVFDSMPHRKDCLEFCNNSPNENRNIIVCKNDIVINTFKGRCDEVNNGLLDTYSLHKQESPLIIKTKLKRDVLMKNIGVVRTIIGNLTRTTLRKEAKNALRTNWESRLNFLKDLDLCDIELNNVEKTKSIAFQLGQAIALNNGVELFTKTQVSNYLPLLKPYLYREDVSLNILTLYLNEFYKILKKYEFQESNDYCLFVNENKKINLRCETYMDLEG